jgi:UDP-2,3-diacylglucosamine pyrophosphatase LpxH
MMRHLFIISDLHLGGRPDLRDDAGRITQPGYQICHAHADLVEFIRWVATQGKGPEVELVINGDLVDFLADDDLDDATLRAQIWTADEGLAIRKLDRIVKRARIGVEEGVFEALRDFLAAGHRLTLLLGNHDVELSLPAVRRRLAELLGGDTARLQFIYDGEAYVVGTVLIEHGNRYDHWNMINYSALRQERSMRSRRLPVLQQHAKERYFVEPAGTYLVIHFMNRIKSRYRFIDLLKPETDTVLPLLLALEPDYRPLLDDLVKAAPVALKAVKQLVCPAHKEPTLPRDPGYMRDDAEVLADGGGPMIDWDDPPNLAAPAGAFPDEEFELREHFVPDMDASLDRVLAETLGEDADYFRAPAPGPGEPLSDREQTRGPEDWLKARIAQLAETAKSASRLFSLFTARTEEQRLRQLHAALRRLPCNDHGFDLKRELPEYFEAAKAIAKAGQFEVVTYGHTHLPKEAALGTDENGLPRYFNTGTWCDVMRLPPGIDTEYAAARDDLQAFLAAIRANDFDCYVRRYLTFLEIVLEPANGTERVCEARLYSYGGPGRERCPPLTSIR